MKTYTSSRHTDKTDADKTDTDKTDTDTDKTDTDKTDVHLHKLQIYWPQVELRVLWYDIERAELTPEFDR